MFKVFSILEFDKMLNSYFSKKEGWIFNEWDTNSYGTGTKRHKRRTTNKKYK